METNLGQEGSTHETERVVLGTGHRVCDRRGPGTPCRPLLLPVSSSLVARRDYPRGWRDLADPKWKGKIIWANPRLSASAYAQLFQLIYPIEGTGLRFDAVDLIKGGPNPRSARLLLDFAIGRDSALIHVRTGSSRSVRPDVPAPEGMPPTSKINLVAYDAVKAAKDREINLIIFDELLAKR